MGPAPRYGLSCYVIGGNHVGNMLRFIDYLHHSGDHVTPNNSWLQWLEYIEQVHKGKRESSTLHLLTALFISKWIRLDWMGEANGYILAWVNLVLCMKINEPTS